MRSPALTVRSCKRSADRLEQDTPPKLTRIELDGRENFEDERVPVPSTSEEASDVVHKGRRARITHLASKRMGVEPSMGVGDAPKMRRWEPNESRHGIKYALKILGRANEINLRTLG